MQLPSPSVIATAVESDGSDKVGPGRPPKEYRFKKGTPSPNPRGRPKKRPRIPAPIGRAIDIIQSMERPVRTSTGKIPFSQSTLEVIKKKVSEGHAPSQRYLDKIFRDALLQVESQYPELTSKLDQLRQAMVRGDPPRLVLDSLAVLGEEYRLALFDPKGDPSKVEKRIRAASRAHHERVTAYLKEQGLIDPEAK